MKTVNFFICVILLLISLSFTAHAEVLKMSTTTSTKSSGLLDILLPAFENDSGVKVKVIAKGTGAAIRDGIDGNVDIIFVHAKKREEKFVKDGYGTKRYPVMHNDFIIIGPDSDPAGIKGYKNAFIALNKIAKSNAHFVSRGDDSGTHTKEQFLWSKTDVKLVEKTMKVSKKGRIKNITSKHPVFPRGNYYSIGQGMGKALTYAEQKQCYVLTDRGTYIKFKYGRKIGLDMEIMCGGDLNLNNPYGIIPINPKKHPHTKYKLAKIFAQWIVSKKAQSMISSYKLIGKQLFYPDSIKGTSNN
jgi:tungstate transport system substrate-binding protein